MKDRRSHDPRDLCADIQEGDGEDPRRDRRAQDRAKQGKLARKDEQLAKLAWRVVEQIVSTSLGAIVVVGAEVVAGGGHVSIVLARSGTSRSSAAVPDLTAVANAARFELARQLNRKRAPTVSIRLVEQSRAEQHP